MGLRLARRLSSAHSWLVRVSLYYLSLIVCILTGLKKRFNGLGLVNVTADKRTAVDGAVTRPISTGDSTCTCESMQLGKTPAASPASVGQTPEPFFYDHGVTGEVTTATGECSVWHHNGSCSNLPSTQQCLCRHRGTDDGCDCIWGCPGMVVAPLRSVDSRPQPFHTWHRQVPADLTVDPTGCFSSYPASSKLSAFPSSSRGGRVEWANELSLRARKKRTKQVPLSAAASVLVPEVQKLLGTATLRSVSDAASWLLFGRDTNLVNRSPSFPWRVCPKGIGFSTHSCRYLDGLASAAVSAVATSSAEGESVSAACSDPLHGPLVGSSCKPWHHSLMDHRQRALASGQAKLLLIVQGHCAYLVARMLTGWHLVRAFDFSGNDCTAGNEAEACCCSWCSDEGLKELVHCIGTNQRSKVMWSYAVSTESSPEAIEVLLGQHHRALTLPRDSYSWQEVSAVAAAGSATVVLPSLPGSNGQHLRMRKNPASRSLPDTAGEQCKLATSQDRKQGNRSSGGARGGAGSIGLRSRDPCQSERASAPAVILRAPELTAHQPCTIASSDHHRDVSGDGRLSGEAATDDGARLHGCLQQTPKEACRGVTSSAARVAADPEPPPQSATAKPTPATAADITIAAPPLEQCSGDLARIQEPALAGERTIEPSCTAATHTAATAEVAVIAAPLNCYPTCTASSSEACQACKLRAGRAAVEAADGTRPTAIGCCHCPAGSALLGREMAATSAPGKSAAAAASAVTPTEPDLVCGRHPAGGLVASEHGSDGYCCCEHKESVLPEPDVVLSRTMCKLQVETPDVVPCPEKSQSSTSSKGCQQHKPSRGSEDHTSQGCACKGGTAEQSLAEPLLEAVVEATDGGGACSCCSDSDSSEVFVAAPAATPLSSSATQQTEIVREAAADAAAAPAAAGTAAIVSPASRRLVAEDRELRRRVSARECVAQGSDFIAGNHTAASTSSSAIASARRGSPALLSQLTPRRHAAAEGEKATSTAQADQSSDGDHRPLIRRAGATGMRSGDSSTFPPMSTATSSRRSLRNIFTATSILSALSRLRRPSQTQPGAAKHEPSPAAAAAVTLTATSSGSGSRASVDSAVCPASPQSPVTPSGRLAAMLKSRSFSDLRGRSRRSGPTSPVAAAATADPLLAACDNVVGSHTSASLSPRRQSAGLLLEKRRGRCRSLVVEGPTQVSRMAASSAAGATADAAIGSAAASESSSEPCSEAARTRAAAEVRASCATAAVVASIAAAAVTTAAAATARRLPVNSHLLRSNRHSMPLLAQSLSLHDLRAAGDGGGSGSRQSVEQARQERSRRLAALTVDELLLTERDYVAALRYVVDEYALPETGRAPCNGSDSELGCSANDVVANCPSQCRPQLPHQRTSEASAEGDVLDDADVAFGNIEEICKFHYRRFLPDLEASAADPFGVGACFLKYREEFLMYSAYIRNKPKSDALMQSFGMSLFKHKQTQLADPLDLSSYLLKPIQRLGKYALILRRLLKECSVGGTTNDGEGSGGGGDGRRRQAELTEADEMIRFCLRHGNDLLALDALCDRLGFAISMGLSSGVMMAAARLLLRQDEFVVVHGNRSRRRRVFLFEHLLLFSKPRLQEAAGLEKYTFKLCLKMCNIGLTETVGSSGTQFEVWLHKRKRGSSRWVLQAPSSDVKDCWVKDISRLLWNQAKQKRDQQAVLSPLKCVSLADMMSGRTGSQTGMVVVGASAADGACKRGLNSHPSFANQPTVSGSCIAEAGGAATLRSDRTSNVCLQAVAAAVSTAEGRADDASTMSSAESSAAVAASTVTLEQPSVLEDGTDNRIMSAASSVESFNTTRSDLDTAGGGGHSSNSSCTGSSNISSSSSNSIETLSPGRELAQQASSQDLAFLTPALPKTSEVVLVPVILLPSNAQLDQEAQLPAAPAGTDK